MMKSFAEEMAFYSAYHQERRNVFIHVLGVPMITFSLMVPLCWLHLFTIGNVPITAATVLVGATMLYYLRLDLMFGLIATLVYGSLLLAAHQVAPLGYAIGIAVFLGFQALGWGTQIYGHYVFEKKKPAFLDNLFQALVSAPLFIIADICFHLGLRKDLEADIQQRLAAAGTLRTADSH